MTKLLRNSDFGIDMQFTYQVQIQLPRIESLSLPGPARRLEAILKSLKTASR